MEQYRKNWELLCELHRLRSEAEQKRSVDIMTITEALSIPKGMNFEEYSKLLKDKQKLEKQIAKASMEIDFEVDSLEVLSDEVRSERYNKHLQNKRKAEAKREKAQAKLQAIMERIMQQNYCSKLDFNRERKMKYEERIRFGSTL